MLGNILLFLIIAAIIGGALAKLIADKKKGVPCSGCPYSKAAAGECSCSDRPAEE
jgi:hypothetical protein